MHHLKYLLIILASSFLLMSCSDEKAETPSTTPTENEDSSTSLGNENENENSQTQDSSPSLGDEDSPTTQNPDPSPTSLGNEMDSVQSPSPSPMNADFHHHGECIKGVYTGRADFKRISIGDRAYNLEVDYNSNEMIFLLTSLSLGLGNGSQVCTIYQNPRFSISEEDETLFNIESNLIEIRGEFIDTRGIFSITTSTTQEQACNGISEFKLYRQGDNRGSLAWFGSPITQPSRVIDAELRSFDELRSDCDALEITAFFLE